jgi:hypothetical protein
MKSPPFLASISALSLTTEMLSPERLHESKAGYIYGLEISLALVMLMIAILGTILRTKLHLDVAAFLMKFLLFAPYLSAALMILNGYMSFLYL